MKFMFALLYVVNPMLTLTNFRLKLQKFQTETMEDITSHPLRWRRTILVQSGELPVRSLITDNNGLDIILSVVNFLLTKPRCIKRIEKGDYFPNYTLLYVLLKKHCANLGRNEFMGTRSHERIPFRTAFCKTSSLQEKKWNMNGIMLLRRRNK